MFKSVLIANRGEIAVRAIRSLKRLGIRSVAVYANSDRYSAHVLDADVAIPLIGDTAADTYLNIDKILAAAKQSAAEAIFPGYGFLSESATFALACQQQQICFIGPTTDQITTFGLKHRARAVAEQAQVPILAGTSLLNNLADTLRAAKEIGYPVMLKSAAGGGGIGLSCCHDEAALVTAFTHVKHMAKQYFNDASVFLERFITRARHVEVQILGDGQGRVVALGERDCTLQRRNQKVIEETPAPNLPPSTQQKMQQAAIQLAQSVHYKSAGTVEFIYDTEQDQFYFLEVNTRLQVEHPITEIVTGLDLIECMLKIACNEILDWDALMQTPIQGVAIEARIYAEDPMQDFQPSPGILSEVYFPNTLSVSETNSIAGQFIDTSPQLRIDHWLRTGTEVSTHFDPMLAKIIVHAADRHTAIEQLSQCLAKIRLKGIRTNLDYLQAVIQDPRFHNMQVWTTMLNHFSYQAHVIEVLQAGTQSSIQDYPGRIGYWNIGVPPSGPMDDYAFRLANRLVGNTADAAAFEFTLYGPCLKFHTAAVIALTGAPCQAMLDDQPIPFWQAIQIQAGQILTLSQIEQGYRCYLAVQQGLDVPIYMGSRATFTLGQFGGHAGRLLAVGDMIDLFKPKHASSKTNIENLVPIDAELIPQYTQHWHIGVLYGPHGATEFFQPEYIEEFFNSTWQVHFNSNRLGVRLSGPSPRWARENGGEAGLHPSNIHDCVYAIGAINFTGDYPVILAKDGPSLGGFVCPVTIAKAELWKIGQLKADDKVSFYPLTQAQAECLERQQLDEIAQLKPVSNTSKIVVDPTLSVLECDASGVILHCPASTHSVQVVYRQAGDHHVLIEYGDQVLDLALRLRVHALMQCIQKNQPTSILALSPGVRSLQIQYDNLNFPQTQLIQYLQQLEQEIGDIKQLKIPSRIIHLPMAFEDSATLAAVERYQDSVCSSAPWLPNNVDFIQRINGLAQREQVREILFNAHYLVLGLGDVYLSAPCAVALDPRHRLLSSKYNPARTFTAEGTVGIGGMYMCIYGMDSPGGYQLVGRTLPIWNKFKLNEQFSDQQWFLRYFDQIKYFPVTEQELEQWRHDFAHGLARIHIEESEFDYAAYLQQLERDKQSIATFQAQQQQAFQTEVAAWYQHSKTIENIQYDQTQPDPPQHGIALNAMMSGNIWKVLIKQGQQVKKGDTIAIIEAMKMELPIYATQDGVIKAVLCQAGQTIHRGDALVYM